MTDVALPQPRPASQGTVVEQTRAAAEVAAAVQVARQFPRNTDTAAQEMRELCASLSVAQRAFYEVPNRGTGLSIHIARELVRIWQNVDYGVRELRRDDAEGISEMQVWAWDQQTNVRSTRSFIQPHQRMKGRQRQQLTDLGDIYLANQNTGARAVRECIFTMLPGWFVSEAEDILRKTLEGGGGVPLEQRIDGAIEKFAGIGVTAGQLVTRIGRPIADWTARDVGTLARIHTTVTVDGIPAREFFPEEAVQVDQS
ncbi:hypothetical protein DEJ21_14150 [Curtobacterium sp. MCSS17_006]|uniref:hypothetical protein n=1 Tax=Curtobacterium sp. MCSS17_006 TaxID=2175642 RepID=UPI000DA98793|nr:hypothetical protein [Curtobacterium sp. MCSS17_006]PZE33987.1 hypothetical protein DEJ21_14150 [Curtobacterium sp. MCSS17_006]